MPSLNRPWRSIAELEQDPDFLSRAALEFPGLADALAQPRSRRQVLKLMAASFAMAGLSGCDVGAPSGHLIPAVRIPPGITPGLPNFYTTAHVGADGFATGILVKHQMGRPIKVEGNPQHPASLGATDVVSQAQLLDFYDPERAAGIAFRRRPSDLQTFLGVLQNRRQQLTANRGAGFRILTGSTTSPTLLAQIDALLARYPAARWYQWDPISRDNVRKGAELAFGQPVDAIARLAEVDVLLAIDSDLLSSAPGHLRYARDFATQRNPTRSQDMSRVYAVESTPTLTGVAADHRIIAAPHEILQADNAPWFKKVSADLAAHPGRALVHVGPDQPPQIHAWAHSLNDRLRAPVDFIEPVTRQTGSLRELIDDMAAGKVSTVLIVDSNPVITAPGFAEALKRVELSVALSPEPNDTFNATTWSIPMAHPWETWGDARAFDGTATILQPQALPLYDGISPYQMLAVWGDSPTLPDTLSLVQSTWKQLSATQWHDALATGVVADSAARSVKPTLHSLKLDATRPADGLSVLFRPEPHLWDGRYATNPWLHELPRPLTKLTWDNPLLISPALAKSLALHNGDEIRLAVGKASIVAPVFIQPGQAPDSIVAHLITADIYALQGQTGTPTLQKTGGHRQLATTEHHNLVFNVAGEIIKRGNLAAYRRNPDFLKTEAAPAELYRWKPEGPAAWGMSIDLNTCIGCNACVVSCQAENNIPVVGREQVIHQREMHWLRVDRYWEGSPEDPKTYFQPMLCMHCEQAPCETACPVGATVHDSEGLNVMVYNRCIGTRFCSQNCPYKVRRFNYFHYAENERRPPASRNPEVSVRARGVMEKCTFCIQRIAEARIEADRENRPVAAIKTACQAACPTQAITFGNLRDPDSEVVKRKRSPLDYPLLPEQNTHPRVTYEARIHNPNPDLET
jgi:MoCo/4Fe-4S cofactor protein with predicted Tat translocation signal